MCEVSIHCSWWALFLHGKGEGLSTLITWVYLNKNTKLGGKFSTAYVETEKSADTIHDVYCKID